MRFMGILSEISCIVKTALAKATAPPKAPAPSGAPRVSTVAPKANVGTYGGVNNMFNMRNYSQGWLGEDVKGLSRGQMLNFNSPWHGFRAGSRNAMNILKSLQKPTIRNFTPIFSPKVENDVDKHMSNISKLSGIGPDDVLDTSNNEQMFRFLTGLAMAESGNKALQGLTAKRILEAISDARTSRKNPTPVAVPSVVNGSTKGRGKR